ncbi:MAG: bifunctional UDP-N-acetylglucosamine diphosphorylase/glucosamine-1-phosphate N-acetyltransferase GlmU [Sandaracinaceae bacterium]|nr:bifunctional UDP-N-acetylglucosamine diphosphorylase/glucosamine-1-phosphate N-acetyltransferase GlmU [Sandaracinaceae bacterium]
MEQCAAVILAAGEGKRMKSKQPKVLHPLAGIPMVAHVIRAAKAIGATPILVVVGRNREVIEGELKSHFGDSLHFVLQPEARGTGDAVRCALEAVPELSGTLLILNGDLPLIETEALSALLQTKTAHQSKLSIMTFFADNPQGYGRILRNSSGEIVGICEEADASDEERKIRECNGGVYAADVEALRKWISGLSAHNNQGELYLTDLVAIAAKEQSLSSLTWSFDSLRGINNRAELAQAEEIMRERIINHVLNNGVTLQDPKSTYIDIDVVVEQDVWIGAGVHLRGKTVVRTGARIDAGSILQDTEVGENAWVKPYTIAISSTIGEGAQVGPFAHLRPSTILGPEVHIGNFVETKNTKMGRKSKANHLAYLGDGLIGENVNVGAGTIFCNYDGFRKHTTIIEDGAFIGSDCQLVAPVRVGRNAYVASGTTVTRNVPEDALAIGRAKQENKEGYAPLLRERLRGREKEDKS